MGNKEEIQEVVEAINEDMRCQYVTEDMVYPIGNNFGTKVYAVVLGDNMAIYTPGDKKKPIKYVELWEDR